MDNPDKIKEKLKNNSPKSKDNMNNDKDNIIESNNIKKLDSKSSGKELNLLKSDSNKTTALLSFKSGSINSISEEKEEGQISNIFKEDHSLKTLHSIETISDSEKISYNKVKENFKENFIEINIVYKINENKTNEKIKIFGEKFVEKNKNISKIIIDGKERELVSFIEYDNKNHNKKLQIKLKISDKVNNLNYMFYNCTKLLSFKDITNLDISNVINMSYIFAGISSLESLPDISKWKTHNVIDMSGIFSDCISLKTLPDISKWNLEKVTNISKMFSGCSSLECLPDISRWDLSNVKDISGLFFGCSSLYSSADISKWNTRNVINMSGIFSNCSSLKRLPNINLWNTINVTNMSGLFSGCSSLIELPDISMWDISNVTNISGIFSGCSILEKLPDISLWNTKSIKNMNELFSGCNSLKILPDISKWNMNNVTNICGMFSRCSSLEKLPDISKWEINNIINMKGLFYDCPSLNLMPEIQKWILNNIIKNNIDIDTENGSSLENTTILNKENINENKNITEKENENENENENVSKNNLSKRNIIKISSNINNNNNSELKSSNSSGNINNPFDISSYLNNKESQRDFLKSEENNNIEKVEIIFDEKNENVLFSNKELLKETAFKILKESNFQFHNNKKGCEPFIIYDKIEYNDSEDANIKTMKEIKIEEIKKMEIPKKFDYLQYNYVKFIEVLQNFEYSIKKQFVHKYKFKIELNFIMKPAKYRTNSIFEIDCRYNLEIPYQQKMMFVDENILNGEPTGSTGFLFMINNMNCENLQNLNYYNYSYTSQNNPIDDDEYYDNFYN